MASVGPISLYTCWHIQPRNGRGTRLPSTVPAGLFLTHGTGCAESYLRRDRVYGDGFRAEVRCFARRANNRATGIVNPGRTSAPSSVPASESQRSGALAVANRAAVIGEIRRVLRPGGRFVAVEHVPGPPRSTGQAAANDQTTVAVGVRRVRAMQRDRSSTSKWWIPERRDRASQDRYALRADSLSDSGNLHSLKCGIDRRA